MCRWFYVALESALCYHIWELTVFELTVQFIIEKIGKLQRL